jgi:hypothetical protein
MWKRIPIPLKNTRISLAYQLASGAALIFSMAMFAMLIT